METCKSRAGAGASAGAGAGADILTAGARAVIHGLTGAIEHNGKAVTILSFNEKAGRYEVEIRHPIGF